MATKLALISFNRELCHAGGLCGPAMTKPGHQKDPHYDLGATLNATLVGIGEVLELVKSIDGL